MFAQVLGGFRFTFIFHNAFEKKLILQKLGQKTVKQRKMPSLFAWFCKIEKMTKKDKKTIQNAKLNQTKQKKHKTFFCDIGAVQTFRRFSSLPGYDEDKKRDSNEENMDNDQQKIVALCHFVAGGNVTFVNGVQC